jgi:hypothetical protein
LEELCRQATRPVYDGVNVSTIAATIVLINMAMIHGVSNAYMDKLIKYLSTVLLPRGNRLPRTHYAAKRMVKKLGLNYDIILCCPNGCVLFRKELEHLTSCPKAGCAASKWLPGSDCIPARVIRHFPLLPRLLRMFRSAAISKLLRYHVDFPNEDKEVMKSVIDSPAWEYVDTSVDPTFSQESRNLRFGLALDGVNPFKHNNMQYSTWPILLLIYNLPPFLVTKKFFIQLSILISRKDAPTNDNMDVFLRPLIEEWKGIPAQDFAEPPGQRLFTLRGILLWTISDYPGYGLISGICMHGYRGCAICGPKIVSRSAKSGNKLTAENRVRGRKIIFGGGRRWTRRNHPYRRSLEFDGRPEFRPAPMRMFANETISCAETREAFL